MAWSYPPPDFVHYWYWEIQDFLTRLGSAYRLVPFYVTSWWRSENQNELVGGHQFSQHLIATAMDIAPRAPYTKADVALAARQAGLIAVDTYPTHVHVQLYPAGFLESWLS